MATFEHLLVSRVVEMSDFPLMLFGPLWIWQHLFEQLGGLFGHTNIYLLITVYREISSHTEEWETENKWCRMVWFNSTAHASFSGVLIDFHNVWKPLAVWMCKDLLYLKLIRSEGNYRDHNRRITVSLSLHLTFCIPTGNTQKIIQAASLKDPGLEKLKEVCWTFSSVLRW